MISGRALSQYIPENRSRFFPAVLGIGLALGLLWTIVPTEFQLHPAATDVAQNAGGNSGGVFGLQWMPLILLGLAAIGLRFRFSTLFLRELNPWMVMLYVWAFSSLLWAPDPYKVVKQVTGLAGCVILAFGFFLYERHGDRFSSILTKTIFLVLALSLLVGIFVPAIGIHNEDQFELKGAWRGITYQKNGLGQLAAVGIIFGFHSWAARSRRPLFTMGLVLLSLVLIVLSRSSTSLFLSIIACFFIWIRLRSPLRLNEHKPLIAVGALLVVTVATFSYFILIGSFNGDAIAQMFGSVFGKDATFSGRTYIWAEVVRTIKTHYLFGVGFNSFWFTPLADESIRRLGWQCPSAHNGYLDIWNTLGVVGFSFLVLYIVRHFSDVAKVDQFAPREATLHFALILYVCLANLTESGWFSPSSFTHLVAMYSSVSISRLLLERRIRGTSGAK